MKVIPRDKHAEATGSGSRGVLWHLPGHGLRPDVLG